MLGNTYSVSSFRDNLRVGADASFDWLINKNRKLFKFEYVGLLKPLVSFSESPEVGRRQGERIMNSISQAKFCPNRIPQPIFFPNTGHTPMFSYVSV